MSKTEQRMRERYEARAETKEPKMRARVEPSYTESTSEGARYKVLYVCTNGRMAKTTFKGSPKDSWVLERGKKYGAKFAIRFWPSKKGWRLCDMRLAQNFVGGQRNSFSKWINYEWSKLIYPNEDAAVMHGLALCNQQPELSLT